jgi:hypothetical protein
MVSRSSPLGTSDESPGSRGHQVKGTFTPAPQALVAAILNTLQYGFQVEKGVGKWQTSSKRFGS